MATLTERMLELRTGNKLKQEEAAALSGIAYRSYRRYKSGEREPTASTLIALADFYGVSVDYLLGRSDVR